MAGVGQEFPSAGVHVALAQWLVVGEALLLHAVPRYPDIVADCGVVRSSDSLWHHHLLKSSFIA